MPPKRKADPVTEDTSAKRQKVVAQIRNKHYTEEELQDLSKEQLVAIVLSTQTVLNDAEQCLVEESALRTVSGNAVNGAQQVVWSPEKIKERANKTIDICHKEIKKQMKWQPSCKQGTTKWSYTAVVPNVEVFNEIFGVKQGDKKWKAKKLDMRNFDEIFDSPESSVRYNTLRITGETVSVKWDPE